MRIAALLTFLSLSHAFAAELNYQLPDFSTGRQLSGPRITAASQKDKGTIFLIWLYEIENVKKGMVLKRFQELADQYKDSLVFIGIEHSPASSPKPASIRDINSLIKATGVTYPIHLGCTFPRGAKIKTFPSVLIFDRDGRLLFMDQVPDAEVLKSYLTQAGEAPKKKKDDADSKKDQPGKPKVDPKKAA